MAKKKKRGMDPEVSRRAQARAEQLRRAAQEQRRRRLVQIGIVVGVAVVAVAIVATAILVGRRPSAAPSASPSVSSTVEVDGVSVPFAIDGSAVRVGPADAAAQVDLWVDYSCPHCQEFEATNNAVLDKLIAGGDVAVSYHNIQIVTDYGTEAGSAAACVAVEDPKAWVAFNPALYANHTQSTDGWDADDFADFAAQQGVNDAAQSCIRGSTYTSWITANTNASTDAGVKGTPTMFLNGQLQSDTPSGDELVSRVSDLAGK